MIDLIAVEICYGFYQAFKNITNDGKRNLKASKKLKISLTILDYE